jgi:uncharacterized protein YndB with AHSA1/START domain
MKWVKIALGVLIALFAIVTIGGLMTPKSHVATSTARYARSPDEVFKAISDFQALPTWRKDLTKIERLRDQNGHSVWREDGEFGPITYEVIENKPPTRLVTKLADPDLPFSGTWTYEVAPVPGGATLKITENGEVKNPIFRFLAHYVFGTTSTMKTVQTSLAKSFGEEVRFE